MLVQSGIFWHAMRGVHGEGDGLRADLWITYFDPENGKRVSRLGTLMRGIFWRLGGKLLTVSDLRT